MLDCMTQLASSPVLAADSLQNASRGLVLASGSATRAALLEHAGIVAEILVPEVDEASIKRRCRADGCAPEATALALASAKAIGVAPLRPGALIIGADQIMICGDRWFDKPTNRGDARAHLQALRGRAHVLHSAVCLVRDGKQVWQHVAQPVMTMRNFSDQFLEAYLALEGDRLLSSVGAYRLEGLGINLFERIEGEHEAILGMPMLALLECLRSLGLMLS